MTLKITGFKSFNFFSVVFSGLLIAGCSAPEELAPPNILWITAEDISPAFGCYGNPQATTPNIDSLAAEGIVYTQVHASAPICAPARSALITGMHATTTGTQHLRSDIPVPESLKILPEYLRQAGYYTTNNSKTDYNFDPLGRWDENSGQAHWKNRPEGKPFFSVFNYGITHEGNTNKFETREVDGLSELHDPAKANLPPYFPETKEMRTIWAHAYDLITRFDMQVGMHVKELREAGELENTIVFVFSDHGFGLPRYKRWCYKSGVHVPLVVYVPEKYKSLFKTSKGEKNTDLISFVDFAPTVMNLAGVERNPDMHGIPFAGKDSEVRNIAYAARSRADDVYDVSRLVTDGKFIYIRNFMPYKPYIQDALIFGPSKRSFRELNPMAEQGLLNDTVMRMYLPKPTEELYDLDKDPYELNNLALDPAYADKTREISDMLKSWLIQRKDIGFLHESEMMIRSEGSSPLEIGSNPEKYDVSAIINAAFEASEKDLDSGKIMQMLRNEDSGVRFWGLNAVLNSTEQGNPVREEILRLSVDDSPAVAILASEILVVRNINAAKGLEVLGNYLQHEKPWVVLNAAISIRRIGEEAKPILPLVKTEVQKYYGDKGAGYNSWLYPMFIGFALDQVILNCGEGGDV